VTVAVGMPQGWEMVLITLSVPIMLAVFTAAVLGVWWVRRRLRRIGAAGHERCGTCGTVMAALPCALPGCKVVHWTCPRGCAQEVRHG
jgi:hypothetical protein